MAQPAAKKGAQVVGKDVHEMIALARRVVPRVPEEPT